MLGKWNGYIYLVAKCYCIELKSALQSSIFRKFIMLEALTNFNVHYTCV